MRIANKRLPAFKLDGIHIHLFFENQGNLY